jgi:origin recognition complex subunit 4
VCLLIAAIHARTAGHEQVTFEQLHDDFRDQVRKSTAAPVQIEGGGIGMVRCSRGVLMGVGSITLCIQVFSLNMPQAFEQLVSAKIFIAAGPTATAGLGREFVKYRCVPDREDVKRAVEKIGQTNLKKWFSKAS